MAARPRAVNPLHAYSLGLKMKSLRTNKGLTLSRLGAETGLSIRFRAILVC